MLKIIYAALTVVAIISTVTPMSVSPENENEEEKKECKCGCTPGLPGIPGQNGYNGVAGPKGLKGDKGDPGPQVLQYVDDECSMSHIGKIRYHQVKDVVQYCNGEEWRTFVIQGSESGGGQGLSKEKPGLSCLALSKLGGQSAGVYWIKPTTSYPAFKTYCRVGGWTLLMKIDGQKQTFNYDSSYWTSLSSFNPDSVEFDNIEAKLASFWTLPFKELLLGLKTGHEIHWITLHKTASSLRSILVGNTYHATNIGRDAWKSLISHSSLQRNCNKEGFNVRYNHMRVRIGISSNQENDCNSNDSWLGFGGFGTGCLGNVPKNSCGNIASCSADNGNKNTFSIGYIFAR